MSNQARDILDNFMPDDDTVVPGVRSLDEMSMTVGDLKAYAEHDWRVYDADCPYNYAHTKHVCGYTNCSEN